MYEIFERLLKEKQLRAADISKATGIPASTFTDWKKGRSEPKSEKIRKIADYLGVSEKYLLTGEELTDTEEYAERLHKDPSLRMLFDAADGAATEDLELAAQMLRKMKKESGYED